MKAAGQTCLVQISLAFCLRPGIWNLIDTNYLSMTLSATLSAQRWEDTGLLRITELLCLCNHVNCCRSPRRCIQHRSWLAWAASDMACHLARCFCISIRKSGRSCNPNSLVNACYTPCVCRAFSNASYPRAYNSLRQMCPRLWAKSSTCTTKNQSRSTRTHQNTLACDICLYRYIGSPFLYCCLDAMGAPCTKCTEDKLGSSLISHTICVTVAKKCSITTERPQFEHAFRTQISQTFETFQWIAQDVIETKSCCVFGMCNLHHRAITKR